jgi:pyruvate dehydrogenase E2 component (dihydrolipoamide acetyltransferase)
MPAVTVPRLGWSMEEGTFVQWLKADGDAVKPGDALFVLESDKSTETIEAIDEGVLRLGADAPQAGDVVKVGQVIGHLLAGGEAASSPSPPSPLSHKGRGGARTEEKGEAAAALLPPLPCVGEGGRGGEEIASPRARRVARGLGIDWRGLGGSGRNGRVRERDVRAASGASEGRIVPHTKTRKIIAARMVAGVTQAAPVTLTTKADATALVALRASSADPPSYLAFLLKAVALALRQHPALRSQWREEGLFVPERIHVAFAVDTQAGLFAPVVRDADRTNLSQITARCRELAEQAREGKLPADDMRGAVFTVSNLGAYGVEAFTPIIHLPQCAVLGVVRIVREPAVVEDRVVPRDRMTMSLTFDHRVTDGAPAARFLDAVRGFIERPETLDS